MAPFPQQRMLAHVKHAGGRPSEYRPEYCQLVIDKMAEGFSLTGFAGFIRVSHETVYRWMTRHSEFSDAVSRARAARVYNLEGGLLAANKGARVTARIFALKNAAAHEWKDVKYQEHAHVHASLRELTDAELLRIIGTDQVSDVDGDIIEGESVRVQQPNER